MELEHERKLILENINKGLMNYLLTGKGKIAHDKVSPATDPKKTVITFVFLTFALSSIFCTLYLRRLYLQIMPPVLLYTVGAMWCPALAAVITRLY